MTSEFNTMPSEFFTKFGYERQQVETMFEKMAKWFEGSFGATVENRSN